MGSVTWIDRVAHLTRSGELLHWARSRSEAVKFVAGLLTGEAVGVKRRYLVRLIPPVGAENVIHGPEQGLLGIGCTNNNVGIRDQ